MANERSAAVAALNDQFRACLFGKAAPHPHQTVVMAASLGEEVMNSEGRRDIEAAILAGIHEHSFGADGNDPYGERDFGAFNVADRELYFKIDYYDLSMTNHSPDATDPAVTHYVMTIAYMRDY